MAQLDELKLVIGAILVGDRGKVGILQSSPLAVQRLLRSMVQ